MWYYRRQASVSANIARVVAEQVVELHMTEGVGHILAFLTGQDEIEKACSIVVRVLHHTVATLCWHMPPTVLQRRVAAAGARVIWAPRHKSLHA